jgi:hypothetical protein
LEGSKLVNSKAALTDTVLDEVGPEQAVTANSPLRIEAKKSIRLNKGVTLIVILSVITRKKL